VHDHWARDLSPEERAAADSVVDLDAEEATCPACQTVFETAASRCPGCGLRLG
jgi:predicted amidophosphoribosyltransferase